MFQRRLVNFQKKIPYQFDFTSSIQSICVCEIQNQLFNTHTCKAIISSDTSGSIFFFLFLRMAMCLKSYWMVGFKKKIFVSKRWMKIHCEIAGFDDQNNVGLWIRWVFSLPAWGDNRRMDNALSFCIMQIDKTCL